MSFFRSLYGKISLIFLALLLVMALIQVGISVNAALHYVQETDQKLNQNLAANLAEEFRPFLSDTLKYSDIQQTMHFLMVTNPRVEIYLLDSTGTILTFFAPPEKIKRRRVSLQPIRQFLEQPGSLPIPGDDPRSLRRQKPFSVAKVQLTPEKQGYLYVILGGEDYDSAAAMVRDSYILRLSTTILLSVFLLTGLVGLLLFNLLTKKFQRMTRVVREFENGNYRRRIELDSQDEAGTLARAFNQMADTIVRNMDELKRTDDLRRELVANVSHDLRSPLASLQGYIETILMKDAELHPDEREKYLHILLNNTRTLNSLVGELFELSKLEARQIEPNIESFCMAELTQDIVLKFQPAAEKIPITLRAELPRDLPHVRADIALIDRALSNLIDNALRFTPRGGTVTIELKAKNDRVFVAVSDTGEGIPAEELPRIFERYYRSERINPRRTGAGLGLAIAQKIIELHNSHIQVKSVLRRGTTFSFALSSR